jgi:hypothetical protein
VNVTDLSIPVLFGRTRNRRTPLDTPLSGSSNSTMLVSPESDTVYAQPEAALIVSRSSPPALPVGLFPDKPMDTPLPLIERHPEFSGSVPRWMSVTVWPATWKNPLRVCKGESNSLIRICCEPV